MTTVVKIKRYQQEWRALQSMYENLTEVIRADNILRNIDSADDASVWHSSTPFEDKRDEILRRITFLEKTFNMCVPLIELIGLTFYYELERHIDWMNIDTTVRVVPADSVVNGVWYEHGSIDRHTDYTDFHNFVEYALYMHVGDRKRVINSIMIAQDKDNNRLILRDGEWNNGQQ